MRTNVPLESDGQLVIIEDNAGLETVRIVKYADDDYLMLHQGKDAIQVSFDLVNELTKAMRELAR